MKVLLFQAYNQHCVVCDAKGGLSTSPDEGGELHMTPRQVRVHTFSFLPQSEDVGKVLEVCENFYCDLWIKKICHGPG